MFHFFKLQNIWWCAWSFSFNVFIGRIMMTIRCLKYSQSSLNILSVYMSNVLLGAKETVHSLISLISRLIWPFQVTQFHELTTCESLCLLHLITRNEYILIIKIIILIIFQDWRTWSIYETSLEEERMARGVDRLR